jgi:Ca2+-binding EF-hand superfamily protein
MITFEELQEALTQSGHPMEQKEIEEIMLNVDYAGNGKINYSEFIAATIEVK